MLENLRDFLAIVTFAGGVGRFDPVASGMHVMSPGSIDQQYISDKLRLPEILTGDFIG